MNRNKWTRNLSLAGLVVGVFPVVAGAQAQGGFYRALPHRAYEFRTSGAPGGFKVAVVEGNGKTDLDVYIYDEMGNLVGSDTDQTDTCVIAWIVGRVSSRNPEARRSFIVLVVNEGAASNDYRITIH